MNLDQTIAEHYARFDAGKFQADEAELLRKGRNRFRTVQKLLPPLDGLRAVEVGCGSGGFLSALKQAGCKDVRGCDLCEPLAAHCRETLGLDVVRQDALSFIQSLDAPADLIFSFDMIEHLDRQTLFDLLVAVRERLTPGGMFIGSTANGDCPQAYWYAVSDITHRTIITPYILRFLADLSGYSHAQTYSNYLGGRWTGAIDRALKTIVYPFVAAHHYFYTFRRLEHITGCMKFRLTR